MHPDLHTDLDNLDSVENNLRHSAKGSLDAYDVAFSLTEAEIISLEAGLRMDGIPAPTLWDLEIEVFHSSPIQTHKNKDVREPR